MCHRLRVRITLIHFVIHFVRLCGGRRRRRRRRGRVRRQSMHMCAYMAYSQRAYQS